MMDKEPKGEQLSGYELSRNWFNWCFENPEKINPNHAALYFFIIEHWNRMGWKEKFGFPMEMAKDAIGIKNYRTYSKTFTDLVEWGFIKIIQKSKNQYSANVIAIVLNAKANTKALSKALQKHSQKQVHGIVGVDKPNNLITLKPNNIKEVDFISSDFKEAFEMWLQYKKERKETYKSETSKKAAYEKLVNLSGKSPTNAILIVKQSMAANWAGMFELKTKITSHPANSFKSKELQYDSRF